MTFGEKLKKIRKERGLSQNELGNMVNMQGRYIGKYELDQVKPTLDAIIKLSKALNISTDYLILDENNNFQSDISDKKINEIIEELKKMNKNDKKIILSLIDAYIKKNQIENIIDKNK